VVRTHPAPGNAVRYSFNLEEGTFTSMAGSFKDWLKLVSNPDLSRKLYSQVTLTQIGMIVSGTFFGAQKEFDSLGLSSVFPKHKANVVSFDDWLPLVTHWTEDVGLHLVGERNVRFTGSPWPTKQTCPCPTNASTSSSSISM